MNYKKFNKKNTSLKLFEDKSSSQNDYSVRITTEYQDNSVKYLSTLSNNSFTQHYTHSTRINLNLKQGDLFLDVGCGRGSDFSDIAEIIGSDGVVFGVDKSEKMIEEACSLNKKVQNVSIISADGCNLPFNTNYFSSARTIRTIQHIKNPERVVMEMSRVVETGGRLVILEPNWRQLAIEDSVYFEGIDWITYKVLSIVRKAIENPNIGQELPKICQKTGLAIISVTPFIRKVKSFAEADLFYSLSRCAAYLVSCGEITEAQQNLWLTKCKRASDKGQFTLYLTLVMVTSCVA